MDEYSTTPNHLIQKEFHIGDRVEIRIIRQASVDGWADEAEGLVRVIDDENGKVHNIKASSLTLIERPKRMVKRTMWRSIYKNPHLFIGETLHKTKGEAIKMSDKEWAINPVGVVAVEVEMLEEGDV